MKDKHELYRTGDVTIDLISLVNTAYDIVEIWDTSESPYNTMLKEKWLKRAVELGAIPTP